MDGQEILKEKVPVLAGEVVDSAVMNTGELKSYFLNEIEYAGCALFTHEGIHKDVFDLWVKAYYKKAKEFEIRKSNKSKKRTKRGKRTRRK